MLRPYLETSLINCTTFKLSGDSSILWLIYDYAGEYQVIKAATLINAVFTVVTYFFLRKKEKNQAKYHFAWVTILHFFVHIPHLNLLTISFTFLNCITIWIKIPFTSLSSLSPTAGLVRLHFSHLRPLVCRKKAFFESKSSRWNNAVTQRFLSIDFPPY